MSTAIKFLRSTSICHDSKEGRRLTSVSFFSFFSFKKRENRMERLLGNAKNKTKI